MALTRPLRPDLGALALERGAEAAVALSATAEEIVGVVLSACAGTLDDSEVAHAAEHDTRLGDVDGLSPRETDVLRLVTLGLSNHEIADELFLSVNSDQDLHPQRLPQDRRHDAAAGRRLVRPPRVPAAASDVHATPPVRLGVVTLLDLPTDELTARAREVRDAATGTRVTYSPKVFIPLTRLCRDRCGYCTFATAPRHIASPYLTPDEVLAIAVAGRRGRMPRGAVHPGRGTGGAVRRGARLAGRPRLLLDGRLPRRDGPAGCWRRPGCSPT